MDAAKTTDEDMEHDLDQDLRRQSRRLRAASTLAMLLIMALVAMPYIAAAIRLLQGRGPGPETTRLFVWGLLGLAGAGFYLWALWAVRQMFDAIAKGAVFAPAVARGISRVGLALAGGSAMSLVGDPNLRRLAAEAGVLSGRLRPFANLLHFDVAYVAVGVVGLAMLLLGRLFARAVALDARARALEAELDEFL